MTRPVPQDFVEMIGTMTRKQASVYWRCGVKALDRWIAETGTAAKVYDPTSSEYGAAYPLPPDYELLATMSQREAAAHYGVSSFVIARWQRETGLKPDKRIDSRGRVYGRQVPADFAEVAARFTIHAMEQRYGVNETVIKRWLKETGLQAAIARPRDTWNIRQTAVIRPMGDTSLAGRAARFLQRYGAVFKASVRYPHLDGYMVWGRHFSTEDMIAKARAKGFDDQAWSRIAA